MTDDQVADDQVTDGSATGATPPEAPELIWLRPERTGRGPRPAHSRDSIAAAAVAIADAEGLDAVSMRRVAAALGAGTMSLYNYVPKKEQLFDLMLDAVVGEYELPASPSGDQRTDLRLLFRRQLGILRRHTWVPRLVVGRPSLGPNGLRYTEYFLACLADADLPGSAKMEALSLLNGFLCQYAEWENTAAAGGKWQTDLVSYLQRVVLSGDYPHLTQALISGGTGTPPDSDAIFDRTLQQLISAVLTPTAPDPRG
ncbi:TetR/AcrR family transcriptional regulator [Kitasatospora sp. MAP5-34]|uniref:TetR/AcrR family transcriptional regulator n=1 Tax=Kitasatospora sp. MAP5-34 TaxID=3035102 RepID=UPI0024751E45|nr:TetR/AcrR family transcriptional regulator [Kitasatospora sp. MAP5-34]MDH6575952.1 AcrR family transcriptional regulator [Kitasatospora sp. MAP5-34]